MSNDATRSSELGMRKVVSGPFTDALSRVEQALKEHGFGILSEIDVTETLNARLGVEMEEYRILGACNPSLAHRALTADREIGLLLPCNVVVRELEGNRVEVTIADPETVFSVAPAGAREQVAELPQEARSHLRAALESLN